MVRELQVWRGRFCGAPTKRGQGLQATSLGRAVLWWVRKEGQKHQRPEREKALGHLDAGPDSWRAAASIFRSRPMALGPMGCKNVGVPRCVTHGGGPGARGCDRRAGGWPAFSPSAPATPRETGRRARGFLPLRPSPPHPHSPSSLPTG